MKLTLSSIGLGLKHSQSDPSEVFKQFAMSLTIEQQLQFFKTILSECQFDLSEAQEVIDNAFLTTLKKCGPPPASGNVKQELVQKKKKANKKSGYSLFMSEKMGTEKMKMAEAVAAWKGLTQEQKEQWNSKVPKEEVEAIAPVKKSKKKSGYSVFLSENMGKDKMNMSQAAVVWKSLPDNKKEEWKVKAKTQAM